MSRALARLGDRTWGTCRDPSHQQPITIGGQIISASPDSSINNRGAARLGDLVQSDCGHISRIITCDPEIASNGRGQARLGDRVGEGPYDAIIITGSADTGT